MDNHEKMQDNHAMEDDSEAMRILGQLEEGQIDVDEAARLLAYEDEPEEGGGTVEGRNPPAWRAWWLVPFSIGIALTAAGAGMATLGSWWWLCAGPLLFVGIPLMTLAAATSASPWAHIRVDTGQEEWPRRIAISLPVPVRLTAWILKRFGHYISGLNETGVDEILIALEALEGSISPESPIYVEIEDGEDGERIEVYLG